MARGGRQRPAPSNPKAITVRLLTLYGRFSRARSRLAGDGPFSNAQKGRGISRFVQAAQTGEAGVSSLISEFQKFRLPTETNQFTDSRRPVPNDARCATSSTRDRIR